MSRRPCRPSRRPADAWRSVKAPLSTHERGPAASHPSRPVPPHRGRRAARHDIGHRVGASRQRTPRAVSAALLRAPIARGSRDPTDRGDRPEHALGGSPRATGVAPPHGDGAARSSRPRRRPPKRPRGHRRLLSSAVPIPRHELPGRIVLAVGVLGSTRCMVGPIPLPLRLAGAAPRSVHGITRRVVRLQRDRVVPDQLDPFGPPPAARREPELALPIGSPGPAGDLERLLCACSTGGP
jgi:hypothetical protein